MVLKVGLLVGREWSWPPRFLEEVNGRSAGVLAEYVRLGGTRMNEPVPYTVLIDRISHEVPYYRSYLKHAVLQGVTVINNPFMWTADDKFFESTLAVKLGVAHPRTIVLPNKDYVPGIVHDESLRNLVYPLDWAGILDYVGLPCVLKDSHGGGWKNVAICQTREELICHYNESGLLTMVVQEFIDWSDYYRCLCLAQRDVLVMKYNPKARCYLTDTDHAGTPLEEKIVGDTRKLMQALGYDMCSAEWAVRDGIPYAIDFMNPAPDMDINSLTPTCFQWAVRKMADLAIDLARNPQPQICQMRWNELFRR
jgi:glutathione synthase/RimK-type ligase-like ATP-grasp enzyme